MTLSPFKACGTAAHTLGGDLRDLAEERLALLPIQLAGLPREEIVDVRMGASRRVA
jgi:hypothetical protein